MRLAPKKAGRDTEHGPAGHPEGPGLDEQDEGDEDKTSSEEKQVHDRVLLDSMVKQRSAAVEEVHLANAVVEMLLEVWHKVHDEEILDTVKLFPTSVRLVLEAQERLARANRAPCYIGKGVGGVDGVVFPQGVTKTPYCESMFLGDAQISGILSNVGSKRPELIYL